MVIWVSKLTIQSTVRYPHADLISSPMPSDVRFSGCGFCPLRSSPVAAVVSGPPLVSGRSPTLLPVLSLPVTGVSFSQSRGGPLPGGSVTRLPRPPELPPAALLELLISGQAGCARSAAAAAAAVSTQSRAAAAAGSSR